MNGEFKHLGDILEHKNMNMRKANMLDEILCLL